MRFQTLSSRLAVSRQTSFLRLSPHSSRGTTNDMLVPVRPARAVRPTRCVYEREEKGRSKLMTQATSMKSMPRETPYSDVEGSEASRRLRFLDGAGVGAGTTGASVEVEGASSVESAG